MGDRYQTYGKNIARKIYYTKQTKLRRYWTPHFLFCSFAVLRIFDERKGREKKTSEKQKILYEI